MKIDRFLQLFVVKEKKFYPLYIQQTIVIEKAATLLVKLLQETDSEKQKDIYKAIKDCEHDGDNITVTIYEELNKTFVTPFDREDIHLLGSNMDTFLDYIHDSAKRILMYSPKSTHKELITIGRRIVDDAHLLKDIAESLHSIQKNPKPINDKCIQIKKIEQEVDDIYETFVSELFIEEKDPIELIKLMNIVQVLEDTTDKAKVIGDTVREIIIKFA